MQPVPPLEDPVAARVEWPEAGVAAMAEPGVAAMAEPGVAAMPEAGVAGMAEPPKEVFTPAENAAAQKHPAQRPRAADALWVNAQLATMTPGSAYGEIADGAERPGFSIANMS